jgi:hypothetical protein
MGPVVSVVGGAVRLGTGGITVGLGPGGDAACVGGGATVTVGRAVGGGAGVEVSCSSSDRASGMEQAVRVVTISSNASQLAVGIRIILSPNT